MEVAKALEAADGALMFGVSTAMIFAVVRRLVLTRFADLRAMICRSAEAKALIDRVASPAPLAEPVAPGSGG